MTDPDMALPLDDIIALRIGLFCSLEIGTTGILSYISLGVSINPVYFNSDANKLLHINKVHIINVTLVLN